MKHHIEKARGALGELHGLATKTEAAEQRILAAANERLASVQKEIDAAGNVEAADEAAQDAYLELIRERGQLHVVIAKARKALGR